MGSAMKKTLAGFARMGATVLGARTPRQRAARRVVAAPAAGASRIQVANNASLTVARRGNVCAPSQPIATKNGPHAI
jgi:hypothetical protein